jgi:hypothetical protein
MRQMFMIRCSWSVTGYFVSFLVESDIWSCHAWIDCFGRGEDGKYWVDLQTLMSFVARRSVGGCYIGGRLSKFSLLPTCLRNSLTTWWSWGRFVRRIVSFSMEHNPCQRYVCEKSLDCWSDGWSWINWKLLNHHGEAAIDVLCFWLTWFMTRYYRRCKGD